MLSPSDYCVISNQLSNEMLEIFVYFYVSINFTASNVCEIGGSDCDVNSKCIANSDGVSYTCQCNDGYKQDGNMCSKDDDDHSK